MLSEGLHATIDANAWPLPRLFAQLQAGGRIEPGEMARTFNCGIGMVVIVGSGRLDTVTEALTAAGETVFRIGAIGEGPRGCTVSGAVETWSAREAWSVTHIHG